jgi:hypothetical protein
MGFRPSLRWPSRPRVTTSELGQFTSVGAVESLPLDVALSGLLPRRPTSSRSL